MKDKRRDPRVEERESVAARIISAPGRPELESKTIFCVSADLSGQGIKIAADHEVPKGSVVELHVAFPDLLLALTVRGTVGWSSRSDSRHAFGIALDDSESLDKWREVIKSRIG